MLGTKLNEVLQRSTKIEPVTNHYFSDGVYIREMIVPAGALVVGTNHTTKHLTTIVSGVMQIRLNDKSFKVEAPYTFEAEEGRKIGLAYTDCVVHNIIPTDSTDIEFIENTYMTLQKDNYELMLASINLTDNDIQLFMSKAPYEAVLIDGIVVQPSPIHGLGVFSIDGYDKGAYIGNASLNGIKTQLGRYINHSSNPNCIFTAEDKVYAIRDIHSSQELTVNYLDNINKIKEIVCQGQ